MHLVLVSLAAASSLVAAVPLADGVTQQLVKDKLISAPLSKECDGFREMSLKFCYEESPNDVVDDIKKCFFEIVSSDAATKCTKDEKRTIFSKLDADLSCVDDFAKVCSAKCKAECTCSLMGPDISKCACSRAKCSDCLLGCVGANEAELTRAQCSKDNLIPFVEDALSECPGCQAKAVAFCQNQGPIGVCLERNVGVIVGNGLCTKEEMPGVKADYCRDATGDDEMAIRCGQCTDERCKTECGQKILADAGCLTQSGNFDTDNDGITQDCEKFMETKCDPATKAATYAQCILDPTNQLTEECTMDELITFTRNYCKARAQLAMTSERDCKSVCAVQNDNCKECLLKVTNGAGCNLLPKNPEKENVAPAQVVDPRPIAPEQIKVGTQVITPQQIADAMPKPIAPVPKPISPVVAPGDVDADKDMITDDCAAKVMEVCDPKKNVETYDTCVSAYVCQFTGYCTSKELLDLTTRFCGLRESFVTQKCARECADGGPDCNDCKDEAYLSAGCLNKATPSPVVKESVAKLEGSCVLAQRAGLGDEYMAEKLDRANDADFKNDEISDMCAESVQKVCELSTKMDSYDECIAANVCKLQGKCKQAELFRFTTQYCVTKLRVSQKTCAPKDIGCIRYELLKGGCKLYENGKVGPAPTIEIDIAKLDKTCITVQMAREQILRNNPLAGRPITTLPLPGPGLGKPPKEMDAKIKGEPEPPKMVIDPIEDKEMQEKIMEAVTSKNPNGEPEVVVPCALNKNKQVQQILKTANDVAQRLMTAPATVDVSTCMELVSPKCAKSDDEGCTINTASTVGGACTPTAVSFIKYKYCTVGIAKGSEVQGRCRLCSCGTKMDVKACPGGSAEACVKSVLAEKGCLQGIVTRGPSFRSQGR